MVKTFTTKIWLHVVHISSVQLSDCDVNRA